MERFELCECFENMEQHILKQTEKDNVVYDSKSVEVVNKAFLFDLKSSGTIASIPFDVRLVPKNGKCAKKYTVNGFARYCPFCGKAMFKTEDEKNGGTENGTN